jgi:hypothetical protein
MKQKAERKIKGFQVRQIKLETNKSHKTPKREQIAMESSHHDDQI